MGVSPRGPGKGIVTPEVPPGGQWEGPRPPRRGVFFDEKGKRSPLSPGQTPTGNGTRGFPRPRGGD